MVSRLFGKLEAQRQRIFGSDGACATACATARLPAAATPPRARNLRRSMSVLLRLTLGPGQAGLAPAADTAAMLLGVLVALEAFEHVVGLFPAGAHGRFGGAVRAGAGAAQEHH